MNQDLKYFAIRLKNVRRNHKLTIEKLAEMVEISPNHISKLEAAKANPSFQLISRIAHALNIEMKDLFVFDDIKNKDTIKAEFRNMIKSADEKDLQLLYRLYKEIKL